MNIGQLFLVPTCVRLKKNSKNSYGLMKKIQQAIPERYKNKVKVVLGKNLMKFSETNKSDFKKQKAIGALLAKIPTTGEKDESHQLMM